MHSPVWHCCNGFRYPSVDSSTSNFHRRMLRISRSVCHFGHGIFVFELRPASEADPSKSHPLSRGPGSRPEPILNDEAIQCCSCTEQATRKLSCRQVHPEHWELSWNPLSRKMSQAISRLCILRLICAIRTTEQVMHIPVWGS